MNAPASLTEELLSQLQGAPLQQIADQLGTNPSQAQSAVSAPLPMLLGALGRNAAQPQGAADRNRLEIAYRPDGWMAYYVYCDLAKKANPCVRHTLREVR